VSPNQGIEMRKFACLLALVICSLAHAADNGTKLEKLGAKVTSTPDGLHVRFARLDDKSAAILKGMTDISTLIVEDGSKLTDRSMAAIGTLKELHELQIFTSSITSTGVAQLKSLDDLKVLYLVDCKLGDSGVGELKGLEKLEDLDISGTAITNVAGSHLQKLAALKLLCVSKTKFGDEGMNALGSAPKLKSVYANNSNVTEKGAKELEAAITGVKVRR
jgi:internalin A